MKIRFLGTAAAEGIPGIFCECEFCELVRKIGGKDIRTRSQALIDDTLLIDFPADTYMHVLRDGLKLHKIHHCIITHAHPDHFYPEDFVMRNPGFATLKDYTPFRIYATNEVISNLKNRGNLDAQRIILNEITPFKSFNAGEYNITPLDANHGTENPIIYLIEKNGKTVLYANDTGYFPDSTWNWLEKNKPHIDFAEFDCCYGLTSHYENHMGFDAVCDVKNRLINIGLTDDKTIYCINHFSHNVNPSYDELENHVKKYGFTTTFDGLEIEF